MWELWKEGKMILSEKPEKQKTNKILRHWICLRAGVREYTQGNQAKHLKFSPSDSEMICTCLLWKRLFATWKFSHTVGYIHVCWCMAQLSLYWRHLTDKGKSGFGSQLLVALSAITRYHCFGTVAALSGGWSVQQSKTTRLTTRKKKKNSERRAQSRTPQSPLRAYPKRPSHLLLGLRSQRFSDQWCCSGDQSFNTETLG